MNKNYPPYLNIDRLRLDQLIMHVVLAGLLLLSLSRSYVTLTGVLLHADASRIRQFGYIILVSLAVVCAWVGKRPTRMAPVPLPIMLLLLWCWFSMSWSKVPSATFPRLVLTTSVVWLAFTCVNRLGVQRSLLLIRVSLGLALLASYAFVIFYPAIGVTNAGLPDYPHQWRGVMAHKNIAGTVAASTGLAFLFTGTAKWRLLRYAMVLAAMVFLLFTESRTSIFGMIIALIAGGAIHSFGGRIADQLKGKQLTQTRRLGLILCGFIATGLCLLTLNGGILLGTVANPDFWTGRGKIWQPMLIAYLEHPAFGTGYGAFWAQSQDVKALIPDASLLGGVTQGHNGYLDLAIQIGLPGLLLALTGVVVWPATMLIRTVRVDVAASAWAIAATTFFLVNNAAETSLFDGDQIPQVFAMLALAILATTAKRRRSRRQDKSSSGHTAASTKADDIDPVRHERRHKISSSSMVQTTRF
jgi:exopolysaccharide production protein ExoQ